MHIYIKAAKRNTIIAKKTVILRDIATLEGKDLKVIQKLYDCQIMKIPNDKTKNYLISILDIIRCIQDKYENLIIHNVGEQDIIVSYKKQINKPNPWLKFFKVLSICLILFAGGGIAIMTFHTDAALPDVFVNLYQIFFGEKGEPLPYLIEIPYSIGLVVGIIVFFNHFSTVHITEDPTPIEVEMRLYEKDVEDCIIESLHNERDNYK